LHNRDSGTNSIVSGHLGDRRLREGKGGCQLTHCFTYSPTGRELEESKKGKVMLTNPPVELHNLLGQHKGGGNRETSPLLLNQVGENGTAAPNTHCNS